MFIQKIIVYCLIPEDNCVNFCFYLPCVQNFQPIILFVYLLLWGMDFVGGRGGPSPGMDRAGRRVAQFYN